MNKLTSDRPLTGLTLRFITSYRKNTYALILGIVLAIALIFSMLTLLHTNHRIMAKQNLFIYTAIDYELQDLSPEQVALLEGNEEILHLGISNYAEAKVIETVNHQRGTILAANESEILAVSTLLEGRMPENQQEVVAEKWALLNLGINPLLGQTFELPVKHASSPDVQQTESFTLVGIINDLAFNKRAAAVMLYTDLDLTNIQKPTLIAGITFKDGNKAAKIKKIQEQLGLNDKQIQANVWQENTEELLWMDVQMGALLIVVCSLVIYGIHRIALMVRKEQYGVLRALGLTKRQVQRIILRELGILSLISLPVGLFLGWLCSYAVTSFAKDQEIPIYFWGKADPFDLIIPWAPILTILIVLGLALWLIGILGSRKVNNGSITEVIFGDNYSKVHFLKIIQLKDKPKLLSINYLLGLKYVFRDIKTSFYVILSLTLACVLFIGLSYQANLAKETQTIRLKMNFFNSDYLMSTYNDLDTSFGIRPEIFEKINEIENVQQIETQAALPVKVIDTGTERNEEFFDTRNQYVERDYGFSLNGNQFGSDVFHTKYKGYNSAALEKLKAYLFQGDFDPNHLEEDEVIVAMPTTSEYGQSKGSVGFFKNGQSVMSYEVGDQLTMKYVSDLKTTDDDYWSMQDNKQYLEKELKVVAIVYYPHMPEVSLLEQAYPLLITSQENFQQIVATPTFETVNLTAAEGLTKKQQEQIENELIQLAVENQQVTARSMIAEKEQLDSIYRKEMMYVIGIALVVLILVVLNLSNNLKYRIETRKRELYLLKALGLTSREMKQTIVFENLIFGLTALLLSLLLSLPVTQLQYQQSQIYLLGKSYEYPLLQVSLLAILMLLFCGGISLWLTKDLQKANILEELDKVE